MGAPITWRSIMGQSLADASRPLEAATRTFNAGFENLRDVLRGAQATQDTNAKQVVTNNTNDALNQIYGFQSAEDFNKAQTSGLFQQLMGQGAQIDQTAVRNALDGRLAILQQRDKQGWEYSNAAQDQREAPIKDQILAAANSGDMLTANILRTGNPNLRNQAVLEKALHDAQRQIVTEGQADTRFKWNQAEEDQKARLRPLEVKKTEAELAGAGLRNQLTRLQIDTAQLDANDKKDARKLEEALAVAAQEHTATKNDMGMRQGALAKTLNLPVNAAGHPDFNNFTEAQLKLFDQGATANRIPTSAAYMTGDTQRAQDLRKSLSGRFSARLLQAADANINNVFSAPIRNTMPVGNDAFTAADATARNQVGFDRQDASNWYAPNSADARKAYEDLATKLPDVLKSMPKGVWFGDNQKDLPDLQAFLGEVASVGIKRKRLEDWVNTPEALQMMQDGEKSQLFRDNERRKKLVQEALFPSSSKK